jgi:hypothetical protein
VGTVAYAAGAGVEHVQLITGATVGALAQAGKELFRYATDSKPSGISFQEPAPAPAQMSPYYMLPYARAKTLAYQCLGRGGTFVDSRRQAHAQHLSAQPLTEIWDSLA